MKNPFLILPTLLIILLMNSCTIHKGQVIDLNHGQTVSISNQAVGTSSVGYFLGLGGNKSSVLLKEAKDDLIRNRPLQSNEKYVNQNLNISTTYLLFYTKTRFTLTADIILNTEHTASQTNPSTEKSNNELFTVGDSLVSTNQKFKGVFLTKTENSKVKVVNRKQEHELLNSNKVYRINGRYKGFKFGEKVEFKGEFIGSGTIKGFGTNDVLIVDKDGSKYLVKYNEIEKSGKS